MPLYEIGLFAKATVETWEVIDAETEAAAIYEARKRAVSPEGWRIEEVDGDTVEVTDVDVLKQKL